MTYIAYSQEYINIRESSLIIALQKHAVNKRKIIIRMHYYEKIYRGVG